MEINWGKNRAKPPLTKDSQVREDAPETIAQARRHASLMDDIITEHQKNGGFDNLEGKGKPLDLSGELSENYYLHRTLKNADVLPPWLELQHEIRDGLQQLVDKSKANPTKNVEKIKGDIEKLNQKIRKYNRSCPSTLFEKPLLTTENYVQQATRWE